MENEAYANGKVYKIVCNITGDIYIGSTTQVLSKRLAQHREKYKGYSNGQLSKKATTSFSIIERGNYDIVLIENVACGSKEELHRAERKHIETNKCVNKQIPTRTPKEYRALHREILNLKSRKRSKEYYEKNAEARKAKSNSYYHKNVDTIREKQNQKSICSCGLECLTRHLSRHRKSKKHQNNIQGVL